MTHALNKISLIFLGTDQFAVPVLKILNSSARFQIKAVITQPDQKSGRKQILAPSPVKKTAWEMKIPVYQPSKIRTDLELQKKLRVERPDFLVAVAYGQILSKQILEIPRYFCVNLHGSLLPKYRGASPIQAALAAGEKITGVTLIRMTEKMDQGPILVQEKIAIKEEDTKKNLKLRLASLGAELLVKTLPLIIGGKVKENPQDESKASFCSKITRESGRINFKKQTAEEIFNLLRAYTPWPGIFTIWQGKRLKILQAKVEKRERGVPPGRVVKLPFPDLAGIQTKKDLLIPLELQLEGKKVLKLADFLHGRPDFLNAQL